MLAVDVRTLRFATWGILVLVSSLLATAEETLENDTTTFVSDLMEDLAPDPERGPSYDVVNKTKTPDIRGIHNYSHGEDDALEHLATSMSTAFMVMFVLFTILGLALVYTQFMLVRDVHRLRRYMERRPPPPDVENPRQEPDLEPQGDDPSSSDDPTFTPSTETEEQPPPPPPQDDGGEADRPLPSGSRNPGGSNPRGDHPDKSTGKTLVSDLWQPIYRKRHDDDADHEVPGHGASETCQVDKGKLERVGEPPQMSTQDPFAGISGASGGQPSEWDFGKLSPVDPASKRASNGAPSPRKKSATPSPTKQKVEKSAFEIQG